MTDYIEAYKQKSKRSLKKSIKRILLNETLIRIFFWNITGECASFRAFIL